MTAKHSIMLVLSLGTLLIVFIASLGVINSEKLSSEAPEAARHAGTASSGTDSPLIPYDYPQGLDALTLKNFSTTSPQGTEVEFKVLTGPEHQTRNPDFAVYVNGAEAGEVGGQSFVGFSFSPDDRYLAFQSESQSGCCDESFLLHVVDLTDPKILNVLPPHKSNDYQGDVSGFETKVAHPFIGSFLWNNNHSLGITSFFIAVEASTGKLYRVSPPEYWNYDLPNGAYEPGTN